MLRQNCLWHNCHPKRTFRTVRGCQEKKIYLTITLFWDLNWNHALWSDDRKYGGGSMMPRACYSSEDPGNYKVFFVKKKKKRKKSQD